MSSMEEMTNGFQTRFQSERLVYTALDTTDRCKEFWWKCRVSDIATSGFIECGQPMPPSRTESDKMLADSVKQRKPHLAVLVCLPAKYKEEEPEPIGFIILNKSFPACAAYHMAILPEYQNKGCGRESINWVADYAFRWCHMRRLAISCIAYNERGLHLYKSIGFVQDTRMRSCFYLNGTWHDLVEFSMLESEWKKLRGISE